MRVYHLPYDINALCTLKPAQTPNVDVVRPTVDWSTPTDFGDPSREDRYITHVTADLDVATAGEYAFQLRSDDGSRLRIDDHVVVDNDGLPSVDVPKTGSVTLTAGTHQEREENDRTTDAHTCEHHQDQVGPR